MMPDFRRPVLDRSRAVPDATVLCPSCFASLKMPEAVPVGHYVKCPRCSLQVRKTPKAGAAKPPADDFFAKVNLNTLASEPAAASAAPPPVPKAGARATAAPTPRQFPLAPLAGGAALLLCGLAVGLTIRWQAPPAPPPRPAGPTEADGRLELAKVEPPKVEPPKVEPTKVEPPKVEPTKVQSSKVERPPPPPKPAGIEHWGQDFEAAKQTARRDTKDVLLLFTGSDWCPTCMALEKNVLREPEFDAWLRRRFEPVVIDYPENEAAKARVQGVARNLRMKAEVFPEAFEGLPTLLLTDADGRPYAQMCGGMERDELRTWLEAAIGRRDERDTLFAGIGEATGVAKARAIFRAATYLQKFDGPKRKFAVHRHYADLLRSWSAAAREADPDNEAGAGELAFMIQWGRRAEAATAKGVLADAARDRPLLDEFAAWRKGHRWRNLAYMGSAHQSAATLHLGLGESAAAMATLADGLALNPPPDWAARLSTGLSLDVDHGTGFLVDVEGHRRRVLTSSALVAGPRRLWVRVDDRLLDATVWRDDPKAGLALVEFEDATFPTRVLRPFAQADLREGAKLVAVGHPAVVPAPLEAKVAARKGALPFALLDRPLKPIAVCGGPLFDERGNLVGVAAYEPPYSGTVDGAVRPQALAAFLKEHLGTRYKPADSHYTKSAADVTARDNAKSVVRVWKSRR